MPPRRVRRVGEVERALIYMTNKDPVWDINDIARDERFMNMPDNVQELTLMPVNDRRLDDEFANISQGSKGSEYTVFSIVQIMQPKAKLVLNYYFSGLLERVNEMQYADRQNAFREAANLAIRQRIEGAQGENIPGNNGEVDEVPIPPAQNNVNGNVMFLLEQAEQGQEQQPEPDGNEDEQVPPAQDPPRAMPIPIPVPGNDGERRPYHALARENAEALNELLTREIPVMTQQLQQTMELMNQLIRPQLDN
ncbi:Hypothetical predicted protein [Paramuricea clavata]|uniref:Uncharacterized protein n=1 Tax=Paramuricea clavata TaxID=317549 RepID=A0A7D9DKA7_PARCT|nr:Hypothetical predicted protein [Paramuricea clavata]